MGEPVLITAGYRNVPQIILWVCERGKVARVMAMGTGSEFSAEDRGKPESSGSLEESAPHMCWASNLQAVISCLSGHQTESRLLSLG